MQILKRLSLFEALASFQTTLQKEIKLLLNTSTTLIFNDWRVSCSLYKFEDNVFSFYKSFIIHKVIWSPLVFIRVLFMFAEMEYSKIIDVRMSDWNWVLFEWYMRMSSMIILRTVYSA
jgi:hypothetical protein